MKTIIPNAFCHKNERDINLLVLPHEYVSSANDAYILYAQCSFKDILILPKHMKNLQQLIFISPALLIGKRQQA